MQAADPSTLSNKLLHRTAHNVNESAPAAWTAQGRDGDGELIRYKANVA